jgi:hypothetical protein
MLLVTSIAGDFIVVLHGTAVVLEDANGCAFA